MADRNYTLPEKHPEEPNWDWCVRAAGTIPAETLAELLWLHCHKRRRGWPMWLYELAALKMPADEKMRYLVGRLDAEQKRLRREAWSFIGEFTAHGSGISAAIAERFREHEPEERANGG